MRAVTIPIAGAADRGRIDVTHSAAAQSIEPTTSKSRSCSRLRWEGPPDPGYGARAIYSEMAGST